jgi:hypothetical protein
LPVPRTTNDQFAILIEVGQDMSAAELKKVNNLLKKTGAVEIKESE